VNAREFRHEVLQVFLQDMHRLEQNNYAWERFSADGVDRSMSFDANRHAGFIEWFSDSAEPLYHTYAELADDASRELLDD
jgi:hypothetical protein